MYVGQQNVKATLILTQVCWPTCMLSFAAWLEILLESMGFGKTRDEIIIGNLTVGTSPSFSLNLTDSLKNNFYCRKIIQTRNCPEFVLDPRGQNEDKTGTVFSPMMTKTRRDQDKTENLKTQTRQKWDRGQKWNKCETKVGQK